MWTPHRELDLLRLQQYTCVVLLKKDTIFQLLQLWFRNWALSNLKLLFGDVLQLSWRINISWFWRWDLSANLIISKAQKPVHQVTNYPSVFEWPPCYNGCKKCKVLSRRDRVHFSCLRVQLPERIMLNCDNANPLFFISAIPTLYHYNSCEHYCITCTRDSNEH